MRLLQARTTRCIAISYVRIPDYFTLHERRNPEARATERCRCYNRHVVSPRFPYTITKTIRSQKGLLAGLKNYFDLITVQRLKKTSSLALSTTYEHKEKGRAALSQESCHARVASYRTSPYGAPPHTLPNGNPAARTTQCGRCCSSPRDSAAFSLYCNQDNQAPRGSKWYYCCRLPGRRCGLPYI